MAAIAERPVAGVGGAGALPQHQVVQLLAAYIVLRSIMVFPKGLPQPWDLGLAAMFLVSISPAAVRWVLQNYPTYVAFVSWVALVSSSWAALRATPQYFIHCSFQIFNLALFALVTSTRLRSPGHFDRTIARACVAGAWLQGGIVFLSGELFRAQGTFRNPNQLGYWALCIVCIYLVVQRDRSLRDLLVIAPAAWAELATTSRAGVVALGIVLLYWLWELLARSKQRVLYMFITVAVLVTGSGAPSVSRYLVDVEVADRIESRFSKDSTADEVGLRNTDRISNYPSYAVLGAGEGDLDRFPYSIRIEIHSTWMTVLFCYGIPGLLLFGTFWGMLFRRNDMGGRVIIMAVVVYSLTHQGMRFTYSWFLLALLATEGIVRRAEARQERLAPRPLLEARRASTT